MQPRKRQHAGHLPQDGPPAKRPRRTGRRRSPSNFPPAFWDSLSKVWLMPRALRELDRRAKIQPPPINPHPAVDTSHLARFARNGGPDLGHLRVFPEPELVVDTMASSRSFAFPRGRQPSSTRGTTVSTSARKSSAYDSDFEQHLIQNHIYTPFYNFPDDRLIAKPVNLEETRLLLSQRRQSLSTTRFTESDFACYLKKNRTASEAKVMRDVIPIISGNADIPNEVNLPFTNLVSTTGEATVKPVPDFFDGARIWDVERRVREDFDKVIIPTKHIQAPVVPNFFLEVKGPTGNADVAERQVCYDGTHGARAIHALQCYGETEPTFDGKAYTFSSTYHKRTLELYAHHITAPTAAEEPPQCFTTHIGSWAIAGDIETFRRGAAAFRNARDLAKRHRDHFIRAANARASRVAEPVAVQQDLADGDYTAWQDAHDQLQQHIAETYDVSLDGGDA